MFYLSNICLKLINSTILHNCLKNGHLLKINLAILLRRQAEICQAQIDILWAIREPNKLHWKRFSLPIWKRARVAKVETRVRKKESE